MRKTWLCQKSVRTDKLSPCLSEDFIRDLCEENRHDASASLLAQSYIQREIQKGTGVKTSAAASAGAPIQVAVL